MENGWGGFIWGYPPEFLLPGSPGVPWAPVLSEAGSLAFLPILGPSSQPAMGALFAQSSLVSFCCRQPESLASTLCLLLTAPSATSRTTPPLTFTFSV